MKTFTLIAIVALMTNESQQINLNNKWGVKDMEGDGTDSMFAHVDISKDEEESNTMASIKEAKKEFDEAAAKKQQEAVHMAELAKASEDAKKLNETQTVVQMKDEGLPDFIYGSHFMDRENLDAQLDSMVSQKKK